MNKLFSNEFQNGLLRRVVDLIKFNNLWSDDQYPLGGVHVKPRPMECKVDAIEVNMLFFEQFEDEIKGVVNINVFHNDLFRISTLSEVVELLIEDALIGGFHYTKDFYRVFAQGKYLRFNNMRYMIKMDARAFFKRYGN